MDDRALVGLVTCWGPGAGEPIDRHLLCHLDAKWIGGNRVSAGVTSTGPVHRNHLFFESGVERPRAPTFRLVTLSPDHALASPKADQKGCLDGSQSSCTSAPPPPRRLGHGGDESQRSAVDCNNQLDDQVVDLTSSPFTASLTVWHPACDAASRRGS